MRDLVFLVDVDNTLLDNGAIVDALKHELTAVGGDECARRYWDIFEERWHEVGFADYLGALQRLRLEHPEDQGLWRVTRFLLEYPFRDRLYPGALDTMAALRRRAPLVVLSDGDAVYQPRKIERSGIAAAADDVLVYVHKEEMLADVERRHPAGHYVLVDDKLKILSAVKALWGARVTTVFVRQGHYAFDPAIIAAYPPGDVTVEHIADLRSRQW